MYLNNTLFNDGKAIVDAFADYFKTFYKTSNNNSVEMSDQTPLNTIDISVADISKAIKKLKNKVSVGPDGIAAIILKKCLHSFPSTLKIIFDKLLSDGIFPDVWKSPFYNSYLSIRVKKIDIKL